ncbi:MAG: MXAN_6640 family putative metalloprotease [Candidatus Zixiibacteriota bacterium]
MKKILCATFLLLIFQSAHAEMQKLNEAYEHDLMNRVRSVFSPQPAGVMTAEDRLKTPVCATSIFLEAGWAKNRLSPQARAALDSLLGRPKYDPYPEYTYDSPAGHFKLHYTTSGENAVYAADLDVRPADGVPDFVNRCAEFFDHAWTYEIDTLGYRVPPSDYFYPDSNGGDGKVDVYLWNMEYLGLTIFERQANPDFPIYTGFIRILCDFSKWAGLHPDSLDLPRVTAAHEFFHIIQGGYDATENEYVELPGGSIITKPYWMEMSATWMEDQVYDGVNDYVYYLPSFFRHPQWSLKTFGSGQGDEALHAYGACVWPIFLSEKYGVGIIKSIWEECGKIAGNNAIDYPGGKSATDIALEARSSTFDDAFREFTVWNYFTGNRARTQLYYSEGNLFPEVHVEQTYNSDTVYSPSGPNHPYGLGSNYVVFEPTAKQGGIKLAFSPADIGDDFEISVVGFNNNVNQPVFPKVQVNHQTGSAEADVYDWTSYNEIIMIPAATSRNGDSNFPYSYSAEYDSSLHGEQPFPNKDWIGQNFPNPFVITSGGDRTYFPLILSSVGEVKINLFTASGELVWQYPPPEKEGEEWTIGDYTEKGMCPAWDGKNKKGEYVAAGVYLYQVKTKNSSAIRKMAVIR